MQEIADLRSCIDLLKAGKQGMSLDELKKKKQHVVDYRAQYEKLKADVADLWDKTSQDGLVDNLSWGFEQEKVERRRKVMAEVDLQPLPLDD